MPSAQTFVVLREVAPGQWQLLGEVLRRRALPARAARAQAVLQVTRGKAQPGEIYAAIPKSEWQLALDWQLVP